MIHERSSKIRESIFFTTEVNKKSDSSSSSDYEAICKEALPNSLKCVLRFYKVLLFQHIMPYELGRLVTNCLLTLYYMCVIIDSPGG
jgi:hypothetical protein